MTNEKLDIYNRLEIFIKYNLLIKRIIYNLTPQYWQKEIDFYNYIDDLSKKLNELERIFKIINNLEIYHEDFSPISKIFNAAKENLGALKPNFTSVNNFYEKYISQMDENLILEVRDEYVGYSFLPPANLLEKAKTINEAMFVIHAKINNDLGVYESIPEIETKENFERYPIRLRGENSMLASAIFDAIPYDIKIGWTDIISLKDANRILMMIRDRGHATTIEIYWENDIVDVDYFIPKVCNYLMVNKLKGVTPVKENAKYATGKFRTTIDRAPSLITELIAGIPMDEHMDIEGGKFYKH